MCTPMLEGAPGGEEGGESRVDGDRPGRRGDPPMPTREVGGACSWGGGPTTSVATAAAASIAGVSRDSSGSASSVLSPLLPSSAPSSASGVTARRGRRRLRRRPRRRPRRTGFAPSDGARAAPSPTPLPWLPPPPPPPPPSVLLVAAGTDAPAAPRGDAPCCPRPPPLLALPASSPGAAMAVVTTTHLVPTPAGGVGTSRAATPTGRLPSKTLSRRPLLPTRQRQIRRPVLAWSEALAAAAGPPGAGENARGVSGTMAAAAQVAAAAAAADDDVAGDGCALREEEGSPAATAPRAGLVTPRELTTAQKGKREGQAEGETEGEGDAPPTGESPPGTGGGGPVAPSTHPPRAATVRLPCGKRAVGGITMGHATPDDGPNPAAPARRHDHHHHHAGSAMVAAPSGGVPSER